MTAIIDNKEDSRKRLNWLISAAINLVILGAVLAATDVVYETNDDFAISQMITDGYPYVRFVNYFLSRVLISIQGLMPEVNFFMLSQIISGFIAFLVMMKVFLDRKDSAFEIIPAVILTALFSLDHYSSLQFTKTAAILMTAGLIWAVDNYTHDRRPLIFIGAFLMFYTGVAYRQRGMFPAIAYAGVFVFIWWVMNFRELKEDRKPGREAGLLALILVILMIPYGIDMASDRINAGTPELRYAKDYQSERVWITDYPLMDFEDNKDKYDAVGINENDLYLIDRWIFDYEGGASLENLKAINEINREYVNASKSLTKAVRSTLRNSFYDVLGRSFSGIHIIIVAAFAVYMLCANRPGTWWYILAFGGLTVMVYISIYYMQRPQYRALYLGEESAAFWLAYASLTGEKTGRPAIRRAGAVLLAAVTAAMVVPAMEMLEWKAKHNADITELRPILEYYEDHQDRFFVVPTTTMGMPQSYTEPLSPPAAPVNATDTGGWDTLTPYKLGCLAKCGVYNPVKELIDDPDMVFVGDYKLAELKEYYNKWYCGENEAIDFVKIDEVDGINLYNVVRRGRAAAD